jgi:hypothetical protein
VKHTRPERHSIALHEKRGSDVGPGAERAGYGREGRRCIENIWGNYANLVIPWRTEILFAMPPKVFKNVSFHV